MPAVLLFMATAGLLAWMLVGYPVVIAGLARWRARPWRTAPWQPTVSVCMAAYNGGEALDRKLGQLLEHDYPRHLLQLVVVSDGSDDDTVSRLQRIADPRLLVVANAERRGKSAALRDAIAAATGEVLVFCDVRQRLEPGSIRALCEALASGDIAVAGGTVAIEPGPSGAPSVGLYWRFEHWLRRAESRSGSVVGVSGALYAVRRRQMPLPPPGLILDDLWVPLTIAADGGRIGLVDAAVAWEPPAATPAVERARKRRTLAGNWQLLARWPSLLVPGLHPLWWRFVSHKVLRLLMPFLLFGALCSSALLVGQGPVWPLVLALQCALYATGSAALAVPALRRHAVPRAAAAFLELSAYALLGLWDFLRRRADAAWRPTPALDGGRSQR